MNTESKTITASLFMDVTAAGDHMEKAFISLKDAYECIVGVYEKYRKEVEAGGDPPVRSELDISSRASLATGIGTAMENLLSMAASIGLVEETCLAICPELKPASATIQ